MRTAIRLRRTQPWPIRVAHWLDAWFLVVMVGSGLQILVAYPFFGPRGELADWYPLQGTAPPDFLTLGHWLAGGRHWHFAFAWFFVLNGAFYLGYLLFSGEWRRRLFLPRRDFRNALHTAAYYLRLRRTAPHADPYNGLQRAAYTSTLLAGALLILTGLVLYKPVQLGLLTRLLGGYDTARALHFLATVFLILFTLGHLVMVLGHPKALASIFTGGPREVPVRGRGEDADGP